MTAIERTDTGSATVMRDVAGPMIEYRDRDNGAMGSVSAARVLAHAPIADEFARRTGKPLSEVRMLAATALERRTSVSTLDTPNVSPVEPVAARAGARSRLERLRIGGAR